MTGYLDRRLQFDDSGAVFGLRQRHPHHAMRRLCPRLITVMVAPVSAHLHREGSWVSGGKFCK
jgi:hypothetical protein